MYSWISCMMTYILGRVNGCERVTHAAVPTRDCRIGIPSVATVPARVTARGRPVAWRNAFARGPRPVRMVDVVIAGIVVGLVLFFFFIFLMLRRTVTGFKEGMEGNRGNDRK